MTPAHMDPKRSRLVAQRGVPHFTTRGAGDPRVLHLVGGSAAGGAAKGALALHAGLLREGVDSHALIQFAPAPDLPAVTAVEGRSTSRWLLRMIRVMDRAPIRAYPRRGRFQFSPGLFGYPIHRHPLFREASVIHLHWINDGFVDVTAVARTAKRVVWTLRDMWPFTGGCHYTFRTGCIRYQLRCGRCPEIGSHRGIDLSTLGLHQKARAWQTGIAPVAISHWLGQRARESALLRHRPVAVIENAIDTTVFRPEDRTEARRRFDISPEATVVLYGASGDIWDPRKGFGVLLEALKRIRRSGDLQLLVFGASDLPERLCSGVSVRALGTVTQDCTLSKLYCAADVFVAPSLQEAFGKTIAEAMACGTTTVSFRNSGPKEIIVHRESGFLASAADATDLAVGIEWALSLSEEATRRLAERARERIVRRYDVKAAARRYAELYRSGVGRISSAGEAPARLR